VFIKSYETNVRIHKINAGLGEQLLLAGLALNRTDRNYREQYCEMLNLL